MKISVNWIKEFTDIKLPVDELVTKIGAQLGSVEEVIDTGKQYAGLVVVKIVKTEKHSGADKLSICWIDDDKKTKKTKRNSSGLIQVVCGAPNVKENMFAVWIPTGSKVPSTLVKDPFEVSTRKIRGVESNGMLASASELGINEDHTGILEITAEDFKTEITAGLDFAELAGLNDFVINLENKMFTHRPDCFGVIGVAREISGIYDTQFISPEWYANEPIFKKASGLELSVEISKETGVSRFMAVAIDGIVTKNSPLWLQIYLNKCGIKPINNVVDITNYIMYLTGQPVHAYDYDKVKKFSDDKPVLKARLAQGEKIKLLNKKELSFDSESVIISTDKKAIGIGGIMGGLETEVDKNTKRIILESATFDLYNIRRTSMKYGLFTEAVARFSKGQSNLQNNRAIELGLRMVSEICGGQQASEVIDVFDNKTDKGIVRVSPQLINDRLGSDLSKKDITRYLRNVEFTVNDEEEIEIIPPFWRQDIEIPEDVVEEVGRLNGYDKLSVKLPVRESIATRQNDSHQFNQKIRYLLSRAGANELLTYSFVHGKLIESVNQDKNKAFRLNNAISPDLQYYRMSIIPSLLAQVRPNNKAGFDEFSLFEIGKTHQRIRIDQNNIPDEKESLALVFAVSDKKSKNYQGAAFYQPKAYLNWLSENLGIHFSYKNLSEPNILDLGSTFNPARSAEIILEETEQTVGVVGEFHRDVVERLKLPKYCAGFEIDKAQLQKHLCDKLSFSTISKYPSTQQDICFRSKPELRLAALEKEIKTYIDKEKEKHGYHASLTLIDIYKGKDKHKHTTYRIRLSHRDRTLITTEVNELLDRLTKKIEDKLSVKRI